MTPKNHEHDVESSARSLAEAMTQSFERSLTKVDDLTNDNLAAIAVRAVVDAGWTPPRGGATEGEAH